MQSRRASLLKRVGTRISLWYNNQFIISLYHNYIFFASFLQDFWNPYNYLGFSNNRVEFSCRILSAYADSTFLRIYLTPAEMLGGLWSIRWESDPIKCTCPFDSKSLALRLFSQSATSIRLWHWGHAIFEILRSLCPLRMT